MKVIVCGGRDFADRSLVFAELGRIHIESPITLLIHGDANGADRLGSDWAVYRSVPVLAVPADWKQHGKAAGPIRNGQMLTHSPALVVAFPGGRGTANMISQARSAGVKVIEINRPEG
jgi:hypothetical protein